MESRLDFQRLLEDMDKVIQAKRLELSELDERLESARSRLSEEEAKELGATATKGQQDQFQQQQQQQSRQHRSKSQGEEILRGIEGEDERIQEQQRQLYEKQLEQFGEELTELESINQQLVKENKFLRLELKRSETNCEELGVKVNSLEESLEEVHSANLELNLRLAYAESEQQLQQRLLKKTHDEDEVLMDAFNDKLESLKRTIETKDEEIRHLRLNYQFLLESFSISGGSGGLAITKANGLDDDKLAFVNGGAGINDGTGLLAALNSNGIDHDLIDSDNKQRVIEIVSALREKDSQIELLKSQLLEATKDLERNASLIESLNKIKHLPDDHLNSNDNKDPFDQLLIDQSGGNLPGGHRDFLGRRYKMLEQELEAKDKQLNLLEFRNHNYETILPNKISDLIQELTDAHQRWRQQSRRILVAGNQGDEGNSRIEAAEWPLNDYKSLEKIDELKEGLERLLNKLQVSMQLLDQIERLKVVNKEREAQIERLVGELNQLDEAKAANSAGTLDLFQTTTTFTLDESLEATKIGSKNSFEHNDQKIVGCQAAEAAVKMNEVGSQVTGHLNPISHSESFSQIEMESKNGHPTDSSRNESENNNNSSDMRPIAQQVAVANNTNTSNDNDSQTNVLPSSSKLLSINSPKMAKTNAHQTLKATATLDTALLNLQTRLRHLEKENELLELAMKEILLALKWTDSQCSTILIDCPSLERLCQLIEARFMARSATASSSSTTGGSMVHTKSPSCGCEFKQNSSDLFQLVVLKGELDLMRGQNEQLRTNMKSQRRDYLSLFRKQQASQYLEMACQTEFNNNNDDNDMDKKETSKCRNCAKSINLINHLLQCIMRIEVRVNSGDELYRKRIVGLHKLIKLLERDLVAREKQLNETRRECHQLSQQKLSAESRLSYLEGHLSTVITPTKRRVVAAENLQVYHTTTATKNGQGDSSVHHQSVTTIQSSSAGHQQQVEPRLGRLDGAGPHQGGSRLTISLLQSIISCLQARLDYKDERLQKLELLLLANPPAGATLVGQSNEPWKRWGAEEGQLLQQSAAR